MAEKDLLEKTLEEHNDVFADIVNALGFGGEEKFYSGPEGRRNIRHVKEMLDFFREFTGDERYREMSLEITRRSEKGENVMSCSMLDYAENKGIRKGVRALIESCRELNQSYDSTLQRIIDKFSLSRSEAEARMREYWKT